MGTARAKKPARFGVSGGRPSSSGTNILSGHGVFSPSQARPSSCATTSAGPVLARFLFTPYRLTDPIRGKSGVFPLGVAAGAGERGEEACSGVDGGRGGGIALLLHYSLLSIGRDCVPCQSNSTRWISKRGAHRCRNFPGLVSISIRPQHPCAPVSLFAPTRHSLDGPRPLGEQVSCPPTSPTYADRAPPDS